MCINSDVFITDSQNSSLSLCSQYPPHLIPHTRQGTAHLLPFPQHFRSRGWDALFRSGAHQGHVFEAARLVWSPPAVRTKMGLSSLAWQRRQKTCWLHAACTLTGTPPLPGVNQPDETLIFIARGVETWKSVGGEGRREWFACQTIPAVQQQPTGKHCKTPKSWATRFFH